MINLSDAEIHWRLQTAIVEAGNTPAYAHALAAILLDVVRDMAEAPTQKAGERGRIDDHRDQG